MHILDNGFHIIMPHLITWNRFSCRQLGYDNPGFATHIYGKRGLRSRLTNLLQHYWKAKLLPCALKCGLPLILVFGTMPTKGMPTPGEVRSIEVSIIPRAYPVIPKKCRGGNANSARSRIIAQNTIPHRSATKWLWDWEFNALPEDGVFRAVVFYRDKFNHKNNIQVSFNCKIKCH